MCDRRCQTHVFLAIYHQPLQVFQLTVVYTALLTLFPYVLCVRWIDTISKFLAGLCYFESTLCRQPRKLAGSCSLQLSEPPSYLSGKCSVRRKHRWELSYVFLLLIVILLVALFLGGKIQKQVQMDGWLFTHNHKLRFPAVRACFSGAFQNGQG